ncbi:MAG: LEA type 2 family protein [Syntrophobacterales bacterium]|jgi:hypothetical protein
MMLRRHRFPIRPVLLYLILLTVLVSCLTPLGCGVRRLTQGELLPPEVRLKGLGLQPPGKQGWPLICVLAVKNPNPMSIKVLGYDYQVWVEGQRLAQGASGTPITLPAQGEATVEVPVLLKLKTLPGLLPKLLREEQLTVEIAGGLRLPQTLGFRVPFRFREKLTPQQGLEHLSPFLSQ